MIKVLLKDARQSIAQKDFESAVNFAKKALDQDNQSLHAYVFLGLASTNLKQFDEARNAYAKAIDLDPDNLLAWQGYLTLYENTLELSKYLDASSKVAQLFLAADESDKALKVLLKAVSLTREKGSTSEVAQALKLILPISPFFARFQDHFPNASETYQELSNIVEEDEKKNISAAIAKGRSRLGVRLADLTRQVKTDVYSKSELEGIYTEIINWTHDDAVRRETESKLLRRSVDMLSCVTDTAAQVAKVRHLAQDMTVINVKDDLAWNIALNWHDMTPDTLPLDKLMAYLRLYPERSSSVALLAYLRSQFSGQAENVTRFLGDEDKSETMGAEEIALALTNACDDEGEAIPLVSVAATIKMLAQLKDWENVVAWSETYTQRLAKLESQTEMPFAASRCFHSVMLATALTYYKRPRFQEEALALLESALSMRPDEATQLQIKIAKARILRMMQKPSEASLLLEGLDIWDAKVELATCQVMLNKPERALTIIEELESPEYDNISRESLAMVYHQKGLAQRTQGTGRSEYFASFIQALRYDSRSAPSYTVLGQIYKYEIKDLRRAEKCFHEAFEISSAEIEAARELASGYAEAEEWDLVEIILQRVIQGNERLRESWCYRALGFVHLNYERHSDAVAAFQASVRLASRDTQAWTGLGEAYLALGRYQAAEKSFLRAADINADDWHPKYLLAVVQLALKEFDGCCQIMSSLTTDHARPVFDTFLCTALLGWAESLLGDGWLTQAVEKLDSCLHLAAKSLQKQPSFALASVFADAALRLAECVERATALGLTIKRVENLETAARSLGSDDMVPAETPLTVTGRLCCLAIRGFYYSLRDVELSDSQKATLWCKIGRAYRAVHKDNIRSSWYAQGVQALKCAVALEPNLDTFWSALGVTLMEHEPRLAHHSLIKATELAPKSAINFANLGHFYLQRSLVDEASAAFSIAQTLDASIALPWYGQGRLAELLGGQDAADLYAHASTLIPQANKAVDMGFTASTLKIKGTGRSQANFFKAAWHARRLAQIDDDATVLYNCALFEERTSEQPTQEQLKTASSLVDRMEALYETEESDLALQHYCDAKALLGRLQLRLNMLEDAIETCEMVIELDPSNAQSSLLSCQLVTAICQARLGHAGESCPIIEELLQQEVPDEVFILLVQALWRSSDLESRRTAAKYLQARQGSQTSQMMLLAMSAQSNASELQIARPSILRLPDSALCTDGPEVDTLQLLELALAQHSRGSVDAVLKAQASQQPWHAMTWLRLQSVLESAGVQTDLRERALQSARGEGALEEARAAPYSGDRATIVRALHLNPA
ncbi:hypothetical protein BCR37DRAFT_382583 [Protomyces lactucae-debilis]|uniref:Superkiller protein 3 n=1 Tax=Protomyces lactucae-debilis TaxID=2754530 RepID=A0A1Y2F2I1_PROLT|nr:uncharacterized protein BCR37DRAFT_382583 [Protomyces lactucae-debilis]ORY77694.1 hypothetical protein BCR37DRAFT_382583 [Protomyces lactucae-debilis]